MSRGSGGVKRAGCAGRGRGDGGSRMGQGVGEWSRLGHGEAASGFVEEKEGVAWGAVHVPGGRGTSQGGKVGEEGPETCDSGAGAGGNNRGGGGRVGSTVLHRIHAASAVIHRLYCCQADNAPNALVHSRRRCCQPDAALGEGWGCAAYRCCCCAAGWPCKAAEIAPTTDRVTGQSQKWWCRSAGAHTFSGERFTESCGTTRAVGVAGDNDCIKQGTTAQIRGSGAHAGVCGAGMCGGSGVCRKGVDGRRGWEKGCQRPALPAARCSAHVQPVSESERFTESCGTTRAGGVAGDNDCIKQGTTAQIRGSGANAGVCGAGMCGGSGVPNSGHAPHIRCREQEPRGRHDCNGREEGTQHRERENRGVLKTGRYASISGGAVQAQAVRLYIPTDERVLSRQLLLPCRRRRADSAQVLQQVPEAGDGVPLCGRHQLSGCGWGRRGVAARRTTFSVCASYRWSAR